MGSIGWQRLPDDLPDEARELAEELRMLFGSLELSMRRYALRCHCDVSTVSRYLNGLHTPPWSFIEGLLSHAAQGRAEPVTQEAATHLRRLHRKAVTSSGAAKGKAQQLHILLEQADEDARQSQAREQMAADMLHDRQFRIQQLQVQLRAVEAARAVDQDEYDNALAQQHQQQEALRNECSRLYAEVGVLREQLTQATVAKELAEERCSQLELQLDAAEHEEQQGAQAPDPAPRPPTDVPNTPNGAPPNADIQEEQERPAATRPASRTVRGPLVREYRLTGTFRGPSAHVASVLHYQNGGYSIVRPDGESHHNKPLFGRPRTVTEVALGVHSSSFSMLLPAAGGVDFFNVEADVQWQVVDPYIVVRARLTDIDLILAPELQDRLRAVSDRFSLDQAKDAWEAMRRALNENATPLGVHLGVQTRAYVRVDLDQAHIHRQAHRYQELLEKGDLRGLAFMMARSPADASTIFTLMKEAEREAADRRIELMRLLLDDGLVSRDDINADARTILNLLRTTPPTSVGSLPALRPAPGSKPPVPHTRQDTDSAPLIGPDGTPGDLPPREKTPGTSTDNPARQVERKVRLWCEETQRIHGPGHRSSLAARHDWARRVGTAGNPAKAAELYRALAKDYTRIHGTLAV